MPVFSLNGDSYLIPILKYLDGELVIVDAVEEQTLSTSQIRFLSCFL